MQARFVRLDWENEARTIGTVYFKPDRPFYFTAGQYTDLTVPHAQPDPRGLTRTMTISSSPSEVHIGITSRFDGRLSSYKQALLTLTPNAAVTISDAMGDMVLPLDTQLPLVFVAGGVGIASYTSMVRWLQERGDRRRVILLYAVRDVRDIVFRPVFENYAATGQLETNLYTSDHKADFIPWSGKRYKSRLTANHIIAAMPPESQIYLSGSQTMVEQLRTSLERDFQVPQYQIAFDYFEGYIDT